MTRPITRNDLKDIRTALEKVEGVIITKKNTIYASIGLPEPCDNETVEYANALCRSLQSVNCSVEISQILQFVFRGEADKDYEVLSYIPIGVPCIRVYPKPKQPMPQQKDSKPKISRWKKLFSASR